MDLLDDGVAAVGLLGLEHAQGRVGEDGVTLEATWQEVGDAFALWPAH
ncbi:hypothetical protein GCE65_09375 [Pseudactinotalea sp. HY158]|nr:hypothetical protein GCE65_09375 [Pseudactinotalea sp. HY158]